MAKKAIIAQIRALEPRNKEYPFSVPDQRGLYVFVRPDGSKPCGFRYTSPVTGKRRLMMLDGEGMGEGQGKKYADILGDAVIDAALLRKDVGNGIDPLDRAKRQQQANIGNQRGEIEADKLNVELMCQWYVGALYGGYTPEEQAGWSDDKRKAMAKAAPKRSAKTVDDSLRKNVYPVIGDVTANQCTVKHSAKVRNEVNKRGARSQANKVVSYLGSAFELAAGVDGLAADDDKQDSARLQSYYELMPDFGVTFNPAAKVKRYNEDRKRRAKERTLNNAEIARLWAEIGGDCMSKQLSLALKLLLSTGQRVEEVLEAEKSEFTINDDGTGEWVIPFGRRKTDYKAQHSEPHIVPLEPLHIDIIKQARQLAGRGKYLFPAQDGGPRTSNSLNQAVRRYCKPQGISKRAPFVLFTPRDCRRSFKTLASGAGAVDEMLDRVQGHNLSDLSSKHYNRAKKLPQKRQAIRTFIQALDVLLNVKVTEDEEELQQLILERFPPSNVVPMQRLARGR